MADQECDSPRLKHVNLYIRRTEAQHREATFLNIDAAVLYLSHLLEVHLKLHMISIAYKFSRDFLISSEGKSMLIRLYFPPSHRFTVMLQRHF